MENLDITGSSIIHGTSYAQRFFEAACCESSATERILRQLYPDGPKCASCGAAIIGKKALQTFQRGDRTYCASCGCKFSPRAGTILADSHLTYSQFEIICVLLSIGADHQRVATMAGVHVDTIATWHSKIKFWESHV